MTELWERLKGADKPILLYGMGDGADKILKVCDDEGIRISGVFASDGFVRHQKFHDFTVISYAEAEEAYGEFIVLLSFASSLPDVMANVMAISKKQELYIPDVPVVGGNIFNSSFYSENRVQIDRVRSLLADERSREVFDSVIEYKLTGEAAPLIASECDPGEVWRDVLSPDSYRRCVDVGAFTGDTAIEMYEHCRKVERIYAIEPDKKTFKRLVANTEDIPEIEPHCAGAWSFDGELELYGDGSRSSGFKGRKGKVSKVDAVKVDTLIDGGSVDYIKYDVEGAEYEALLGSRESILREKPDLLVSLYHRSEDIFKLPLLVHEMLPEHKLYIRRFRYFPAWDLNLYAVSK